MNKHILIAFLLMSFLGACGNNRVADCNKCVSDKNGDAKLLINISVPDGITQSITVSIYEGPLERNDLLYQFSTYHDYIEYPVMADKDYTVTAEYVIGQDKYLAVDSARPHVQYDDSSCDMPCYYVAGNRIDLRLKYTK